MYSNISKTQAFPLVAKLSSHPKCFNSLSTIKTQFSPLSSHRKPILTNPTYTFPIGKSQNPHGFMVQIARRYCAAATSSENQLPWLETNEIEEGKVVHKAKRNNVRSSVQEDSAKKKVSVKSSWEQSVDRLELPTVSEIKPRSQERKNGLVDNVRDRRSDTGRRYNKFDDRRSASKTFSTRYGKFDDKRRASNTHSNKYNKFDDNRSARNTLADIYDKFDDNVEERVDDEMEDEVEEGVDDPRWDNIKNKFKGVVGGRGGSERPEFRRWDRNEDWGRKTWKEASESTVPKIVGEGIYGVGPVLAALSAGRREFYALYVQQGLDLSSNNRKKKDKKGFERVLKMAEKINLSVKEASKHDLNMVADNRPHQGLVLDASPLEMVRIQELEPVSVEEGKGSLWVALDEVTDPQNLGAIIRSSYFFGATGIVLCAKNSAPLSGVVSKASAGSLELMELRFCKNMMQFLVSSAENGWRVLGGSVSSKAISLNEIEPGPPTILVLGSEGTGLRPLVERSCTQLVKIVGNIPLDLSTSELEGESTGLNGESSGKEFLSFLAVESLNVSVATGVLLHHLIGKGSVDSLPDAQKQLSE
ncbi:tRNA/rRNA methyltransferase (SpoU) family protein [Trifolium repens]|nr:tRNA/rRNA methyltransferase (SpoU) family protein [Trifolium repens]